MSKSPSRFFKDGIECEEVQGERRLSDSLLWTLQEEYYAEQSLKAWERVPFYSTSRMMFVGAIAELVNSFLLDCADNLDYDSPVYILELGGGSGCFAYRFLTELVELMADFEQLKNLRVQYILSDFAQANIDAHLKNVRLKPFLDSQMLEISVYRPDLSNSIDLVVSGQTLKRGQMKNPLVVLANYFFDTIKQDAFRVADGKLQEAKFTLYREADASSLEVAPTIQEIRMSEQYYDLQLPYYNDPSLDSILDFYGNNLQNASVIFPIGAMRSLENLSHLAGDKLAVFASDKGFASLDSKQIVGLRPQEFAEHGAFSFDVNFDALQRYFRNKGGSALIESGDHSSLGFMFATTVEAHCQLTNHFFRQYIQKRDVCNASYNLEEFTFFGCDQRNKFVRPYLTNFISIVQSSNFDPFIFDGAFARLFNNLLPELTEMDSEQEREVTEVVYRTFKNIFNVANEYFDLAAILEFCMRWEKFDYCLALANEAVEALGPTRKAYDYAAMACEQLNRKQDAYDYFRQALALQSDHDWARAGMARNKP
ncbi:MAG: hypothetical protein HYX67_08305 [Candidatus Melainabacteria bacterium]|nr:hypothetical protein [Candidatus Melainabacteria bacterium]